MIAEERASGLVLSIGPDDEARRTVWADEDLLVRAVSNLVSNALRHAAPGSTVLLDAHTDETGGCRIAVSNEGTPIAEEMQQRIFERFYRGVASRADSSSSSGLGLAIVQSIMRLHRGSVTVASGAGERTTFTLAFAGPAASDQDTRSDAERTASSL